MASVDSLTKQVNLDIDPMKVNYWYVDVRDRTWRSLTEWQKILVVEWANGLGIDTSSAVRVQVRAGDGFVEVIGYVRDFDGRCFLDENRDVEMEMYYVFYDELPDLEVWRD